jgi:hypothetical protein
MLAAEQEKLGQIAVFRSGAMLCFANVNQMRTCVGIF